MYRCEFCATEISDQASFCGQCGRAPGNVLDAQTRASDFLVPGLYERDTATSISVPENSLSQWNASQHLSSITSMPTSPLSQEEEEEERHRRAAMLGINMPLISGMAAEDQPYSGNVSMIQGTPQISDVPTVQGTPQPANPPPSQAVSHYPIGGSNGQGFYSSAATMAPHLPSSPSTPHVPDTRTTLHHPYSAHPPHNEPPGCGPTFIIVAVTIPILIILSFIGMGLTVFAPSLSLTGSADVEPGGTLTLHGSHFIPASSVTLTLDDSLPLYFTGLSSPVQSAYATKNSIQVLDMGTLQATQTPLSSNTVSVGSDGAFNVTITVSLSWSIGKHTIKATESLIHRSAELDFTIHPSSTTPSSTGSDSLSPSPTATITPSVTATPTGLSCVNPSSLTLGPVSQGYTQPVSVSVRLCTIGTGVVNWTATWNQNAVPWLRLDHTSGQTSAPGQVQVNVSALASNLAQGSYSGIITFTSQPNNVTESLPVSFTVQAGCINGTPNAFKYTGIASVSDPATQTVTIANCGPLGAWSARAQTTGGANWLFASPAAATLNAGATANVTIRASNLKAQLAAGTYSGTVTFKIGSASLTLGVTITVLQAPILTSTPKIIYANQQCSANPAGFWICYVSLTNTSANLSLNWSASSSGLNGVTFNPPGSSLKPGQTTRVLITVPQSDCPAYGKLLFTGPANTVTVEWSCTKIGVG